MSVARFCARLQIPRSTWYYWRSCHLQGREVSRWPSPVVDAIEEAAAEQAHRYSAWGHRKIWALLRRDGVQVSAASVKRALRRRGLLLPVRYQAERRQLAQERKATFVAPPSRRNQVWQTDFTQWETTGGGTWIIAPVVDYTAKLCLAAAVSGTQAARDAIWALEAAITAAEKQLGRSLVEDLTDAKGELHPLSVVTDNGPAYKSMAFQRFMLAHPELRHVRTRHRAPQTNGVVERFNESLKYEHLMGLELADAIELTDAVEEYRELYNHVRPHEALDFQVPVTAYLDYDEFTGGSVQET
jgi:transposase InsO family protein